jgi:hypothetical protein
VDGHLHALAANPLVELGPESKAAIEDWVQRMEAVAREQLDAAERMEGAAQRFGEHVTRMRTGG